MPEWIGLCLDSMRRRCVECTITLLTADTVDEALTPGVLHPRWRDIPPGIGTDALRAALLATHGGLWLDADTVLLRDPAELLTLHDERQFLYSRWPSKGTVCAGYVYAPRGNRIAAQWLAMVNAHLEHAENVGWMDLGERMLTPIVASSPSSESSWEMPSHRFLPVDISSDPGFLLTEYDWRSFVHPETIGFALNHSWLEARKPHMMRVPLEEMARSRVLVHRLLAENAG